MWVKNANCKKGTDLCVDGNNKRKSKNEKIKKNKIVYTSQYSAFQICFRIDHLFTQWKCRLVWQ